MALVQIIPCGYQALDASWGSPLTSNNLQSSEIAAGTVWPVSGVFRNFVVRLSVAPGAGNSHTITVRLNGVNTAMVVTLSGAAVEGSYTAGDLSVTAGDELTWQATTSGTPATTNIAQTIEFLPTDGVTSGYTMRETLINTGSLKYNAPFSGDTWTTTTTQDVVATDGTITALYGRVSSAPSGGNGVVICLYLNGVKQDGTGDTVDTTLSFLGAASASAAFSLPVTAGDVLYLEATPTGSYTARNWSIATTLETADADRAMICGRVASVSSSDGSFGLVSSRLNSAVGPTEEAAALALAGVTDWTASHVYVALTTAPGAAKSYTFVLRENSATPTDGPSVTISGTDTAGHDLDGSVAYTTGDTLTLQFTPTGTPTAFGQAAWAILTGPPIVPPLYTETRPEGGESLCAKPRIHTWLEWNV